MRGADLVVKSLTEAGVKTIFTLSGNQIMPIFDACFDAGIRLIHTRHESAAVFMADAYAQVTGEVGIALVTAAPGFANGLGGVYSALMAESPVVFLSGDSPRSMDGKGAFQELDQVAMSAPVTKLSLRPKRAEELGNDMATAIRTATSGRPGPVHVALPFDLLNAEVGNTLVPVADAFAREAISAGTETIKSIADAVARAERPVILTGPLLNRSRGGDVVAALETALDAPVFAMESPRGIKDPSLGGVAKVLAKADVVLSLGKNMDFTTGFAKPPTIGDDCRFYMIDPDSDVIDRAHKALGGRMAMAVKADAPDAARALTALGKSSNARAPWRAEIAAGLAERQETHGKPGEAMHPAVMSAGIQQFLDSQDNSIAVIDGGEVGQWAQAGITAPTRLINGPSGAIGGCLCYAIAAKIAEPDRTVVVIMGDGTAGFHFAEFETAARYGAGIIAVIGQDCRWNAEYQIQLRDYGSDRLYECELSEARYDLAAAGLGCQGERATTAQELSAALNRAADSGKPACIVAMIEGHAAPSGH
ncbi:MAG: thiamine pyrophosphate-binding protein [Rhodospirillaceae bacterium]